MVNSDKIRCAKEFRALLWEAKLDCIRRGKKVPSDTVLTRRIASRLNKEDILYDEFIPFK